jgi:AcrR family transcriptional regulator
MTAEDRRAALVEATIPLLHEFGLDVSTRRIAEAAGVAEGTIFGVFPDKHSLILAALLQALDPQSTLDAFAGIDPGLGLRFRLIRATDLINERFTANADLMAAARKLAHSTGHSPEAAERMTDSRRKLQAALTELVEPDHGQLRRSPVAVAHLLLLFCGANAYGPFGDPGQFNGEEMVSLLLDGVLIVESSTESLTIPLFGAETDITGVP